MSAFISAPASDFAPARFQQGRKAKVLSFPAPPAVEASLSVPHRGILLGGLVSGALWVALLLAARALWIFLS